MNKLDRFRNHASARDAGVAAMAIITAVQDLPYDAQVHGMVACFALLCDGLDVRPSQLLEITTNLMDKADGYRPEFRGVASYFANDLL